MKRSQVSFEFVSLFTLVVISSVIFLALVNSRLYEMEIKKEELFVDNLIEDLKNEVTLATQVQDNYIRNFEMPLRIYGNNYTVRLVGDELMVDIVERNVVLRTYHGVLPVSVKGGFVDAMTKDTLKHCITKNNWDGIRIALNQVSIEFAGIDMDNDMLFARYPDGSQNYEPVYPPGSPNAGSLHVDLTGDPMAIPVDSVFFVFLRINCVENIRSIQMVIKYDPAVIKLIRPPEETFNSVQTITDVDGNGPNPFFREQFRQINLDPPANSGANGGLLYIDPVAGRYTHAPITRYCESGSGNVVVLGFRVEPSAANTDTEIAFDPAFSADIDPNLMVLDCSIGSWTRTGLPDTIINLPLHIVP